MVTATDLIVPLDSDEQHELDRLEGVVERGLQTFLDVGTALAKIRDGRLYRATHSNFEAYLADRYEGRLGRRRADQLIAAARVGTMVRSFGAPAPSSERQARELAGLSAEHAASVMTTVAESGQVTAAMITAARREMAPEPVAYEVPPDEAGPWFDSVEEAAAAAVTGECTDDEFDQVLANARRDGDLSREHVADLARKAKEPTPPDWNPQSPARRRRPLLDAYRDRTFELDKGVSALQRLQNDTRWPANRGKVAAVAGGDLRRILGVLQDLVDDLDGGA